MGKYMKQRSRKFSVLLVFLFLFSLLPLNTVYAGSIVIDTYNESNQNSQWNLKDNHPSDSAEQSAAGQTFDLGATPYRLTSVKFYLSKSASPTGNAYAKLYALNNSHGSTGTPMGSPLATSDAFDVSTLGAGLALTTFTFTGVQQYILQANTNYTIAYENPSAGIDGTDYVNFALDTTSPTHDGNVFVYINGAWTADAGKDHAGFYVYGDANLYAPTITSTTISDIDDTDNVYTMKKYYSFVVVVDDADGATDIENVSLRAKGAGGTILWQVSASDLTGAGSWDINSGSDEITINATDCTFVEAVDVGTATFKIALEWDHIQEEDIDLAIYVEDSGALSTGFTDNQTNYFDVISRTVIYNFNKNVSSVAPETPIELSGYVRYAQTNASNLASSSYPPDSEFTNISIQNDQEETRATDNAIVNGFFNVSFTSHPNQRTTLYYAYLNLKDDYTDGLSVDGDYVTIYTTAPFYVTELLDDAADFFGFATSLVAALTTFLETAIIVSLAQAFTNLTTMVVNIMLLVFNVIGFITTWTTNSISMFITLSGHVVSILDGTSTVISGLDNLWETINFSGWSDAVPVLFFVSWMLSVDNRARRLGGGWNSLAWGDITIAMGITSYVMDMMQMIINTALDLILKLIDMIP